MENKNHKQISIQQPNLLSSLKYKYDYSNKISYRLYETNKIICINYLIAKKNQIRKYARE